VEGKTGEGFTTEETGLSFIRQLILEILENTPDASLSHNTHTRIWNRAIREALEVGFPSHNWRSIAHFLMIAMELTFEGDLSAFIHRVCEHLVKEE